MSSTSEKRVNDQKAVPVYFQHGNAIYQALNIVSNFGWLDVLLPQFPAQTLKAAHQEQVEKRGENAPTFIQVLQEALRLNAESARKCFNANRKVWSKTGVARYLNAYYKAEDLTSIKSRAKHYTPAEAESVEVVITPVKLNKRVPLPVAILCSIVSREQVGDASVSESIEQAFEHYDPEQAGALPVTGHQQYYGSEFGANPDYLLKRLRPEKYVPATLFRMLSGIRRRDADTLDRLALSGIKTAILTDPQVQAAGFITLNDENGQAIATVPKLPLACWALRMARAEHQATYRPYSPMGMKMNGDSQYHSDWMIAAGLDLETEYRSRHPVQEAAWRWAYEYQKAQTGVEFMVLSHAGAVKGRLFFATKDNADLVKPGDIVVIPHAGPQYQLHVEQACKSPGQGGVITLVGHKAAHLSIVGRERGFTVILVPDVTESFVEGQTVKIDPVSGMVSAVSR